MTENSSSKPNNSKKRNRNNSNNSNKKLMKEISKLKEELEIKNEQIQELEYELSLKDEKIEDIRNDLELKTVEIDEYSQKIEEKDQKITNLNNTLIKYKFEKEKLDLKLKNEINYRKSDYFEIYVAGENCNYKHLCFKDKKIFLLPQNNKNIETEFNQFINKIGTTDTDGQLAICDEYLKYFKQLYSSLKEKEASKMRTNMSLSLFGALSIIIVFL